MDFDHQFTVIKISLDLECILGSEEKAKELHSECKRVAQYLGVTGLKSHDEWEADLLNMSKNMAALGHSLEFILKQIADFKN